MLIFSMLKGYFMRLPAVLLILLLTLNTCVIACSGNGQAISVNETAISSIVAPPVTTKHNTTTVNETAISTVSGNASPISDTPDPVIIQPEPSGFKIVGYLTHWHADKLASMNIKGLTHLIFQGVEVSSGNDPTLRVPAIHASWEQITEVVKAGHANGTKVLISLIGFWKESNINQIWKSKEKRSILVDNLKTLVLEYGLDGIDIDNENKPTDSFLYSTFIKELHDTISPLGKIITMAGNPYQVSVSIEAANYLEFVNVMTYDLDAGIGYPYHSTLEESIEAITLWSNAGIPKEKILIGIPFYGRDGGHGFYNYWQIVDKYQPTANQNVITEPGASGGIIWWNGPDLVKAKTLYAKDNDFGGVMLYEIGTDTVDADYSLLQSVYVALKQHGGKKQTGVSSNSKP